MAETVLDQIVDWVYAKIVGFLNDFFSMMNNMGVELFDIPWVEAVTTFFSYFAWTLFVVGMVVGMFECAIEYQGGRGSAKDTGLNFIKGFMAVSLFSVVPIRLYALCVTLQATFGAAIAGVGVATSIEEMATNALAGPSLNGMTNPIIRIFCAILMGYAVIRVFFANLKRGGILVIQIAVGNSGQGKSYLLKLLLIIMLEAGFKVLCLDPEHEYVDLTKNLQGCFIDLMSGEYLINVLEPKSWDENGTPDDTEAPMAFRCTSKLSQHFS